jgi:hypothetical protein
MSTDLKTDLERARRSAPGSDADFESLLRRRDRQARGRKASSMALALFVGLAVIAGAFTVVRSGPGAGAADGNGVDLPAPQGLAMPAGSYLYRRTVWFGADGRQVSTSSVWWAADGSGRTSDDSGHDTTFGLGELPTDTGPLGYLSTDAAVLRDQMIERMAPDGASPEPADQFTPGPGQPDHVTAGMIRSIGELLSDPNTTPDLRAALFRVAAGLDGVTLTRGVLDPTGRPAIELQVTTETSVHHWWFDPETQQQLATQDDAGAVLVVEAEGFTGSSSITRTTTDLITAPRHDPQ